MSVRRVVVGSWVALALSGCSAEVGVEDVSDPHPMPCTSGDMFDGRWEVTVTDLDDRSRVLAGPLEIAWLVDPDFAVAVADLQIVSTYFVERTFEGDPDCHRIDWSTELTGKLLQADGAPRPEPVTPTLDELDTCFEPPSGVLGDPPATTFELPARFADASTVYATCWSYRRLTN